MSHRPIDLSALKAAGLGAVEVFDLRDEWCALEPGEWTPHLERDPSAMQGVVLHAWGTRSVGTEARHRRKYGEPLALARRGLATPYTINAGVTARGGAPIVGVCHPVERYTYASDAGNKTFLAVAIMGRFAFDAASTSEHVHTPVTDALRLAVDAALFVAWQLYVDACIAHDTPQVDRFDLLAHRQCANGLKDHFACPGEEAIRMALGTSSVREFYAPRPDLILPGATHGKTWPAAWRRHLQVVERPDEDEPVGFECVQVRAAQPAVQPPELVAPATE